MNTSLLGRAFACAGRVGVVSLVLSSAALAQRTGTAPSTPGTPRDLELWVSGYNSNAVHRFDPVTGDSLGILSNVRGAQSIRGGRGGYRYIVAEKPDTIRRYRGLDFESDFIADDPDTPEDETGGLINPTAAIFGPDGNLYVASFGTDEVLRYDGETGAFLDVFVSRVAQQ